MFLVVENNDNKIFMTPWIVYLKYAFEAPLYSYSIIFNSTVEYYHYKIRTLYIENNSTLQYYWKVIFMDV